MKGGSDERTEAEVSGGAYVGIVEQNVVPRRVHHATRMPVVPCDTGEADAQRPGNPSATTQTYRRRDSLWSAQQVPSNNLDEKDTSSH